MPKYSFECPVHGAFELTVPISQHQDHPQCPIHPHRHGELCSEVTVQTYTPERPKDWAIRPVVVHVGKGGKIRFPGNENAPVPKGFNKVELKSLSEIEAFEHKMNRNLSFEAEQHHENEERCFSEMRAKLRGELRQDMKRMSPLGRDFARLAMQINDRRRRKSNDVGFHLQILHFDQSNREPFREGKGYKPTRWI